MINNIIDESNKLSNIIYLYYAENYWISLST